MDGKNLVCDNCGRDYCIEDHDEKLRKNGDYRDIIARLCPECMAQV